MAAQCCTNRIFAFEWVYLALAHCFSVISENIAVSHILPKTTLFWLSHRFFDLAQIWYANLNGPGN